MPRVCTVCAHDDRAAIDEAIVRRVPSRTIASLHSLDRSAILRHKDTHVSAALVTVQARREAQGAETLADRVEALYERAGKILDAAEAEGRATVALAAVRELRGIVELLGKLSGELDERPNVNVLNVVASPDWMAVRQTVLAALQPYPDASAAVAARLLALETAS